MAFTTFLALAAIIPVVISVQIPSTKIQVEEFTTEGITGKLIDISAKGYELYGMDDTNTIYRFDSSAKKWTPKPKPPQKIEKISASPQGGVWATSVLISGGTAHQTYALSKSATTWGNGCSVHCWVGSISADSDTHAVGFGGWDKNIMIDLTVGAPSKESVPAVKNGSWLSIGEQNERWYIDNKRTVFRLNPKTNVWDKKPGSGVSLDVECPKRVVMTCDCGSAYIWGNDQWDKLPVKNAKFTTVNNDAVYVLTNDSKLLALYPSSDYDCTCDCSE
jgi:hypothetical protein